VNTIDVTLHLPEDLVKQATAAGILTDERMTALLETEIERQKRVQRFAQTVQQLRALEPAITEDEVEAEIQAYRAEKAARKPSST
jgi:hypothetical protein